MSSRLDRPILYQQKFLTIILSRTTIILIILCNTTRCRQNAKQCRPWSDWSGYTLFALLDNLLYAKTTLFKFMNNYSNFFGCPIFFCILWFLAHLSRRLTKWAYRMGLEPASVRPCYVHTFKHEYLRDQQAHYNQILSEASLGWGKGCIRFWCRSGQNSGFHGNG